MIGGNTIAQLQRLTVKRNEFGEQVKDWSRVTELMGWLDLSSGDSKYLTYNAKVQESTHIFICDYVRLPDEITAESSRFAVDGRVFDIMLIDDPMGMHRQLEIYLKYTGGQ
ncbi:head-tail adaptor protein [Emergencia timonensis]|uniref:phage head completion protein n=1 Tax=Emergencia timonensis TaxID=1776384 RepID=UPI0039F47FA4